MYWDLFGTYVCEVGNVFGAYRDLKNNKQFLLWVSKDVSTHVFFRIKISERLIWLRFCFHRQDVEHPQRALGQTWANDVECPFFEKLWKNFVTCALFDDLICPTLISPQRNFFKLGQFVGQKGINYKILFRFVTFVSFFTFQQQNIFFWFCFIKMRSLSSINLIYLKRTVFVDFNK